MGVVHHEADLDADDRLHVAREGSPHSGEDFLWGSFDMNSSSRVPMVVISRGKVCGALAFQGSCETEEGDILPPFSIASNRAFTSVNSAMTLATMVGYIGRSTLFPDRASILPQLRTRGIGGGRGSPMPNVEGTANPCSCHSLDSGPEAGQVE